MRKILFLFCPFIFSIAGSVLANDDKEPPDVFLSATPVKIKEAWLRFHELDLCQGLDAKFTFNKEGMELKVLVENEKLYQKFMEIIESLRSSYKIVVDASRPEKKRTKEENDDRDVPPTSLWENYELRSYLGDAFARRIENLDSEQVKMEFSKWGNLMDDDLLKRQLLIFGEKVLSLNKSMKRYSDELPNLAQAAADADPDIRSQALSAAKAHAQNIEKAMKKLNSLLSHAFPDPNKKEKNTGEGYESKLAGKTLLERALCFSKEVSAFSDRINHFIYPKNFAVSLKELRQPSLLEEFVSMQQMDSEFIINLGKP